MLKYKNIVYKNRGLTVDAIVLKGKKVLLIKRKHDPCKGAWALPGGFIEWHESAEEALNREVFEETNLQVVTSYLVGAYTNPKRDPRETMSLCFFVTTKGEVRVGDDAEDYMFYALSDLPGMAFDHKKMIEDFLLTQK